MQMEMKDVLPCDVPIGENKVGPVAVSCFADGARNPDSGQHYRRRRLIIEVREGCNVAGRDDQRMPIERQYCDDKVIAE